MKIEIKNFRVVNKPDVPRFKAVTDVILEECLIIRDIKLLDLLKDSVSKLFIAMPSKKTPTGEYKDICHPTIVSCRAEIERPIVEYFKYGRYSEGFKEEFKVTEVKVRKIDSNNELSTAKLDLVFNLYPFACAISSNFNWVSVDTSPKQEESRKELTKFG